MELDGVGVIIVKPPQTSADGHTSQLLLESLSGAKRLLAESSALDFVGLLKGDLDGDQTPEVVAIAKTRESDDFLPYVFHGQKELKQVFPPREEDNPLFGKEITIVPGKVGSLLCVKTLESYHDFGPPDLYVNGLYQLRKGTFVKTGERVLVGTHFNPLLNNAGRLYHKGSYLEAMKVYEAVILGYRNVMPREALATALFFKAETRKWLKDFSGAIADFKALAKEHSDSPLAARAEKERTFLTDHAAAGPALSLYIDVVRLQKIGKNQEALTLLDQSGPVTSQGNMNDALMFLRGEILVDLGRVDEALQVFRNLKKMFPKSSFLDRVETTLQELEVKPDEME